MGMGNRMRTVAFFNFMHILEVVGITGMAGVAQLVELWIVIPMPPSNISDLTPKTADTNRHICYKQTQNRHTIQA